jgi:three-Cys-motif partner protein
MTAFWGDDTWKQAAYETSGNFFGWKEKQSNDVVAAAFRQRLNKAAGFEHVPEPIPMRNTKGAIVYYLFFASPKPVAAKIVTDIFDKYRNKGTV